MWSVIPGERRILKDNTFTVVRQFIFLLSHVPIPPPKDVPREQQEILGGVQEETSKDSKGEQESRGGKEEKEDWPGERIDFISCTHRWEDQE